jgi:hypothetical protein
MMDVDLTDRVQVNADWLHGEVNGASGYIPAKYVSGY